MITQTDIKLDAVELDSTNATIARVVVEDLVGRQAIAFLSAKIKSGRVRFELTTKLNRRKETSKAATADWVL
jgi:hypothetical protein